MKKHWPKSTCGKYEMSHRCIKCNKYGHVTDRCNEVSNSPLQVPYYERRINKDLDDIHPGLPDVDIDAMEEEEDKKEEESNREAHCVISG
jgi:hypothetical protein